MFIQHLRERITVSCWFGFQIKPPGYDCTELVSAIRFKNPVTLQNSKHPLLLSITFLPNIAS
jgi:hypothetical protein